MIETETVKHYEDKNYVEMEGTLIKTFETGNAILLTVLTTTGRKHDQTTGITVRVVDEELKDLVKALNVPSKIRVTGKLRTRQKTVFERIIYDPVVYADTIENPVSELEKQFGLEGRSTGASYNKIVLAGMVTKMTQINRNVIRAVIGIDDNSREKPVYIETVLYARNNLKKLVSEMLVGNRVCLIAEYQSVEAGVKNPILANVKNGEVVAANTDDISRKPKKVFYNNIVVQDIKEV